MQAGERMSFTNSQIQLRFPSFLTILFAAVLAALTVYFGPRAEARQVDDTARPFATLTVTNTNDSGAGSLRQAVIDAVPGDTIVFGGGVTGAITLTSGEILIDKNLTIDGPGAAVLAISGNNSSRIFNFVGGTATVDGLTIRNGRSGGGGAMQALGTILTFNDLVITNNVGTGDAGVMITIGVTLNINRSTITNNTAQQISALYLSSSTMTVTDSTFSGNSAPVGDVIRNEGSTSTLINTTISGNTSDGLNSGIRNNPSGGVSVLNLTNCTITNNITANAGQRGAIWLEETGTNVVTVRNSIVSGNMSGGVPFDIEGTVDASSSFNLIGTGGGLTNGVNGNIVGVNNPQLAPLASNGGPTQTRALLAGSPAIDKGSSFGSTTDQRGSPRPVDLPEPNAPGGDAADIGAFEIQSGAPTPTPEPSPLPKADYQFQGNPTSSVAGAPAMTNLTGSGGANSFVTDTIDGYNRQTLRFPFNSGLQLTPSNGVIPNGATYTIVILVRFDQVSGFRRVASFDGRTSDDGAYIQDGRLEFEPTNTVPFVGNTYLQLVIVREAGGTVRGYRDGVLRVNQPDGGTFQISPANNLSFFQDDNILEASDGNVARIRLYDVPMTTAQVQALDRLPNATGGGEQSIVFSSLRDGFQEIYTMNPDGTNQFRLTNDSAYQEAPKWSPDGSRILMESDQFDVALFPEIVVMNANGTNPVRLTNNTANDASPEWSPNGDRIVFTTNRDGNNEIYLMNANGTNPINLTNNAADDRIPCWSPDGTKIGFTSSRDQAAGELYVMNADGTNPIRLTTNTSTDNQCAWSPDGTKIAFWSDRAVDPEIYVMNADGSNQVRLTTSPGADFRPAWSPDGSRLIFISPRNNTRQDLWIMNADGTNQTRLMSNSSDDFNPNWKGLGGPSCGTASITIGQAVSSTVGPTSCVIGNDRTDLYSFPGNAGQQVAVTMETSLFFSKIELVNPAGVVVASAGGVNGVNNSRLPATGFFTLPVTGTYTIRAIAAVGGAGSYTLSLFEAPVGGPGACTYSLSRPRTDVPMTGGVFSFDVITQPGCPPAAAPAASGTFYTNAAYSGGRVTFTMPPHPGTTDRQEVMAIAGQSHTIFQYCTCPPTNDFVDNPNLITGANNPPNAPERGSNVNASAQSGEPAHAGNTASKSVWYVWTAPSNGLWSFSTSGSSFDTVMAIYRCPAGLAGCNFTNFTQVGTNDDTTFFDVTSKVNFRADQGATYLIAIDGKNGASGTIELSWRQYERLFRLYLQNYNGNQSPLVPDTVTASNGSNTVIPTIVSLGVYEFNLPADDSAYTVTISGPTGIVWDPNNFPLDTSFRLLNELMEGPEGAGTIGGQNTVSNAQNQTPRFIYGFIRNITAPEVPGLGVIIGSSRGPNPREEAPCSPLGSTVIASVAYATYQCLSQPNTLHDIVPAMPGKNFVRSVLSFEVPIAATYNGTPGDSFIASNSTTYNITGQVLAGGAGTRLDLTYTPTGNTQPITIRRNTDADGRFTYTNLPPNTYRLKASRTGLVFTQPADINLTADTTINISPESSCSFSPANTTPIPVAGGLSQFTVAASSPTCEWAAASDVPWITINSGAIVGNGPVHFTAQPNPGAGRIGTIRIAGRPEPVLVQQSSANPTFTTISGRVTTPNLLALRNAVVTLIDATGTTRTATTSSFGVFNFAGIETGQIYTASVNVKRYRFTPKTLTVTTALNNVDFIGLE